MHTIFRSGNLKGRDHLGVDNIRMDLKKTMWEV
jgi:hypothetical protein